MLDASVAISWVFEDERDDDSLAMADAVAEHGALVPALFRWEFQNALLTAWRRKRLSEKQLVQALEAMDDLDLQVDNEVLTAAYATGFNVAQRFELTAYDTAYLELALRRSSPLMTRDRKLREACLDLRVLWVSGK